MLHVFFSLLNVEYVRLMEYFIHIRAASAEMKLKPPSICEIELLCPVFFILSFCFKISLKLNHNNQFIARKPTTYLEMKP